MHSGTAENKSTAKVGKATWTEHRAGEEGKAQQAEKHAAAQHSYKSQEERKPAEKDLWIKVEKPMWEKLTGEKPEEMISETRTWELQWREKWVRKQTCG